MALEPFQNSNRIRWIVVGFCSSVLIALLCRIRWGEAIGVPCLIKWLIGIPCPMCGMTRSLTALLQGDLERSMSFHGLGVVLLVAGFDVADSQCRTLVSSIGRFFKALS